MRNNSCAAASGSRAVLSGAESVGARMPTTSNGVAADVERVADRDAELARHVGTEHRDGGALVGGREQPALGGLDGPPVESLVRAGDDAVDELGDAEASELDVLERHLDARLDRADAAEGRDLVGELDVDRHETDPEAAGGAVAHDDLADVEVAPGADERVDLGRQRAEDDERPDPDDDADHRERRPQAAPGEIAQEAHDALAGKSQVSRDLSMGVLPFGESGRQGVPEVSPGPLVGQAAASAGAAVAAGRSSSAARLALKPTTIT